MLPDTILEISSAAIFSYNGYSRAIWRAIDPHLTGQINARLYGLRSASDLTAQDIPVEDAGQSFDKCQCDNLKG